MFRTSSLPLVTSEFHCIHNLIHRNISIKQMQGSDHQASKPRFNLNRPRLLPGCLLIMLVLASLGYLEYYYNIYDPEKGEVTHMALSGVGSAVFHVAYSYTSTCIVLEKISVVSHAVANICKRVLVVILLYWFGHRVASPYQWLGFMVCLVGLAVYVWGKHPVTTQIHEAVPSEKAKTHARFGTRQAFCWKFLMYGIPLSFAFLFIANSSVVLGKYGELRALSTLPEFTSANGESPDPALWRNSFNVDGFKHPTDEELMPDLSTPRNLSSDIIPDFLRNFTNNPTEANGISKELSTSFGIIREAQRLHFNIITDTLKGFKYAMLLDIAAFENKGDPCITMGEIYYLKRIGLEIIYYCESDTCTSTNLAKASQIAKRYSRKDLIILLHGGGNILMYYSRDKLKIQILRLFAGFSIVIFPQSVNVRNPKSANNKEFIKAYCCNSNLTIITRDRLSFDTAKRLFNGSTKILMAPDMAFQIGHMPRFMSPVFDILWIRRQDSESIGYTVDQDFQGYTVHVSDWITWRTPSASNSLEKAFYTGTNGFFYLQRGRVVITDRLHGHILSTLMDIPHVILDNKDFKISRYHNTWTKGLENTVMTDDYTKALDLAIGLLKKYNHTLPPTVPYLSIDEDHGRSKFGSPGQKYP